MRHRPCSYLVAPLLAALALGSSGCGSSDAGAPPVKSPAQATQDLPKAPPPPPAPAAPPGHVARATVDRVLTQYGPPWLLRRVMYEEVFDAKGKFAGWRLTGVPEEWSDIDLQPGDVVKRVNGQPLETPDQVWEAWKATAKERAIRVSLERDGAAKELVIPIDGEPSPETAQKLEADTGPRPQPERKGPAQRGVIRIGGDEPEEGHGN